MSATLDVATSIREFCGTLRGYRSHRWYKEKPCDACRIIYNADQLQYHKGYNEKNPEKVQSWAKAKYDRNPKKQRESTNKWRAKNMENEREYHRAWREANREKISEYGKRHNQTVKGKTTSAANSRRRRARKLCNGFEPYTEIQVLELYGTDCHICGEPIDLNATRKIGELGWEKGLHLDHVIPISKGGVDTIKNVKPSHGKCNIKKSFVI